MRLFFATLQRTGVAQIDVNDRVLVMKEKPKKPKSNWAVPPFYIFRKDDMLMPGNRYDIGTLESYEKVK